jgi:hypothetical protein
MTGQSSFKRALPENGERQWERYAVQIAAQLISIEPSLRGLSIRSCTVMDISIGGASIFLTTTMGLPDHYYLVLAGLATRIGCAEAYRNGNRVGVKFIKLLDPDVLTSLLRKDLSAR